LSARKLNIKSALGARVYRNMAVLPSLAGGSMKTNWLFLCFVLAACAVLSAIAQAPPSWEQARSAIAADYAKQQPKDKLLQIEGPEKREGILIALRYYARALIERADGTRSRDGLFVEYRLFGDKWELQTVRVYESQALADVPAPSSAEAQRLFAAAWPKEKCDGYEIQEIKLDGDPRYQLETTSDRATAKRWYVYNVKIAARGNGKFRMSEDGASYLNATQNLLLWDPAQKSWSVDPRQVRCSGWVKQK
jgi:hypothetical protein